MRRPLTISRGLVLLPLTLLVALVALPSQAGAFGELTYRECTANTNTDGCGVLAGTILSGAQATAISPDGTSVYVVSDTAGTITHFVRNADGSLTFADCDSSTNNVAGCDGIRSPPGPMLNPNDVAVSPDGKSVYVVSRQSNSLIYFSRAADGSLEYQKCFDDNGLNACTNVHAGTQLTGAASIALSPDGSSIYVGATTADTIAHFTTNASGAPVYADCIADDTNGGCTAVSQNLLDAVSNVSVSPDGKNLYAGTVSFSVSHFTIGANGTLSFSDCANQTGIAGCLTAGPSLRIPIAVAAAPGGIIYVVARSSNALVELSLDGNRKMSFSGCIANNSLDGCADMPGNPFDEATSVNLSPDGESVYVTAMGTDQPPLSTLTHFIADGSGRLTFDACQGSTNFGGCVDLPGEPMNGISDVVVAPGGDSLYAVGGKSNSVSHFSRNAKPIPPDVTPPETTINSGPRKKEKRRTAKVTFSSSDAGSTFSCTIDGGAPEPCNSPFPFRVKKKPKKHVFTVAATDAAGNVDATPATTTWKVKAKKKHHHGGHKHHGGHG